MTIRINTPTYLSSSGRVTVASNPQPAAHGWNPPAGSLTGNGYTVFRNNGGGGTAMDSYGTIRSGRFDMSATTGRSVFVPDRW